MKRIEPEIVQCRGCLRLQAIQVKPPSTFDYKHRLDFAVQKLVVNHGWHHFVTASSASRGYRDFSIGEVLCPDCWHKAEASVLPEKLPTKKKAKPNKTEALA